MSVGLGAFLYYQSYQSNTVSLPVASEEDSQSGDMNDEELMPFIVANLANPPHDKKDLDQLFDACEKARAQSLLSDEQKLAYAKLKIEHSEIPMQMMAGIQVLKELEETDSTNTEVLEILGQLSVQSGQLEKAKKRYQKLLSLQPGNEKYKQMLENICEQLGDSDCF